MDRDSGVLVALTGVAFLVLAILGLAIGGEPPDSDNAREVVDFYADNKDSLRVALFIHTAAIALLVLFGAFLRSVLQAAEGAGTSFPRLRSLGR